MGIGDQGMANEKRKEKSKRGWDSSFLLSYLFIFNFPTPAYAAGSKAKAAYPTNESGHSSA